MKKHEVIEVIEKSNSLLEPQASQPTSGYVDVVPDKKKKSLPQQIEILAQQIDSCEEFYGFYGLLDGLSVTYSSLKFMCEIFTCSSKEYNDWLETLLTEPEWVLLVSTVSVFIASFSTFANYLEKYSPALGKDGKPILSIWNDICLFLKQIKIIDLWEYFRNISKGVKNGFKGTKSFIALFLTLEMLNKALFKRIFFPISLSIGVICAINRAWNISMKKERKSLSKQCGKAIDKVSELNNFLEEKQAYKNFLRALSLRITRITKLDIRAKELGIKTFRFHDEVIFSKNDRNTKKRTLLSGSRSLQELQVTNQELVKQSSIENELRELLTCPEVTEQEKLIINLKSVIEEDERQGKLPSNYLNVKHPLVEKLIREQNRLIELKKTFNSEKIYSLSELKEKQKEVKEKLALCIATQKNKSKKALCSLFQSSATIDDFWNEFNKMLPSLNEATKKYFNDHEFEFRQSIESLHQQLLIEKALKLKAKIGSEEQRLINERLKNHETNVVQIFESYNLSDPLGAQLVFNHLAKETNQLKSYCESIQLQFLLSNILAGIVDAPYLYIGIMSLAVISSQAILMALTLSVISFTIVSVLFRAYEEVESNNACKLQMLKVKIAQCDNQWKLAQNNYYKAYEKFKLSHLGDFNSQIDGTENAKLFLDETRDARVIPLLVETYNNSQYARESLKEFINPSYYSAVMHGSKDALSFFGAIASCYYALNIALMAFGAAFPPVLIIGAVSVGVASLIGFVSLRLYLTYQMKLDLVSRFKIHHIEQEDFHHDKPSLPLGWADVNTDGLTKGELFFQELNEVARCVCAGLGGKAHGLMDFLFSKYKDHDLDDGRALPIILMLLTISLSLIYGAVLALRAFSKGFKNFGENKAISLDKNTGNSPGSCTDILLAKSSALPKKEKSAAPFFSTNGIKKFFGSGGQCNSDSNSRSDSPNLLDGFPDTDSDAPIFVKYSAVMS